VDTINSIQCAVFLTIAFVMAGLVQSCWLRSRWSSRYFGAPLDARRTLGGRRILGDNKTYRGFVGMIPATGLSFLTLRMLVELLPETQRSGLWQLTWSGYLFLGCWVGFGFMLGELPNSFVKRRIGIAPGAAPMDGWSKVTCFLIDRLDSILGGLLALAIVVSVPAFTWIVILIVGPVFHWSFNLLLFYWGVKARPA
jgi:CDP-2,3-bis-(O-geranylgeranyl)-sn-glycerol synthase